MSIDKSHLDTILEPFSWRKMLKTFDKKYSATNSVCICQLFYNCQAIDTQKNVAVVEKYEAILNFNAKIYI